MHRWRSNRDRPLRFRQPDSRACAPEGRRTGSERLLGNGRPDSRGLALGRGFRGRSALGDAGHGLRLGLRDGLCLLPLSFPLPLAFALPLLPLSPPLPLLFLSLLDRAIDGDTVENACQDVTTRPGVEIPSEDRSSGSTLPFVRWDGVGRHDVDSGRDCGGMCAQWGGGAVRGVGVEEGEPARSFIGICI